MSESYKERCLLTDDAVAMWSFDGDAYDAGSYLPLLSSIIDEVDNQSPAYIQHESPTVPSLTIGHPSLIELESSNQYSAIFGSGFTQSVVGMWPKSYATAPHSSAFSFSDHGSFTVEFVFRKTNETAWAASYGTPAYWEKYSPIIRKAGVFEFSTHSGWGGEWLIFNGPLGRQTVPKATANYESGTVHVVATWEVKQIAEFEYLATQTLYVNNRLVASVGGQYFDNTYPNTNIASAIEIGGYSTIPTGYGSQGDRNASRLYLDQVSIYSKALTHNQVSTHYKKIFTYRNMVINESPEFFWDCSDQEVSSNTAIAADIGGRAGTLMGGTIRNVSGPSQLPPTGAVQFSTTGSLKFPLLDYYSSMTPFKNISGDYTFEFWFRTGAGDIATLLSMQGLSAMMAGWWK